MSSRNNQLSQKEITKAWWEKKRLQYNLYLIASGFIAFILFFIIEGYKNVTLFSLIFQGIAACFIVGIANVFYLLGASTDNDLNKSNSLIFRKRLFNFGLGLSVLLPFTIPLLLIVFPPWDSGFEPLSQKPSNSELLGVYELNNNSKKFLIYEGYNIDSSRIELKTNNQYYFHKLPDNMQNGFGTSTGKTTNQNGEWKVYNFNRGNYEILIDGGGYMLRKKENRFCILITIGDPDSRQGIVYVKQQGNNYKN